MRADPAGGPLRVLIVDDDHGTTGPLALLVRSWGFRPVVAHDGPAALAAALAERPDVVLLDLGLPGMDGYEVAARLRGRADTARTPLVALTGHGGDEYVRRSREAGFARHLVKPVDPEEIHRLLNAYGSRGDVHAQICARVAALHRRPGFVRRLWRRLWGR
jgi:DNA-binding response OmpR family regulator